MKLDGRYKIINYVVAGASLALMASGSTA